MDAYVKSEFKTRVLEEESKRYSETESLERMDKIFGQDQVIEQMQKSRTMSADDIFQDRYSQELIPGEKLEEKVDDTYQIISRGKKLSSMQKGKRAKSAEKKIINQRHLRKEQEMMEERRKSDNEFYLNYMVEGALDNVEKEYTDENQLNALRQWTVYTSKLDSSDEDHESVARYLLTPERKVSFSQECEVILKTVNQYNPADFSYASDEEFISRFAEKYEIISKNACADVFLNKYLDKIDKDYSGLPVSEIRAKIAIFKEIKADYDNRMTLISSPYYSLLSRQDLKPYMGKNSEEKIEKNIQDPNLKAYLRLAKEVNQSKVGKGKDVEKLYKETLLDEQKKSMDRDVKILKEKADFINGKLSTNDPVTEIYIEKQKNLINELPEDDLPMLKDVEPVLLGTLIGGNDIKEFKEFESKFIEILEQGTFVGQELKPEELTEIKEMIRDQIAKKRDAVTYCTAYDYLLGVSYGMGCEVSNPLLANTKEMQSLKQLMSKFKNSNSLENIEYAAQNKLGSYFESIVAIYSKLASYGYSINKKYEDRVYEKADECVEDLRKLYEKRYYEKNSDIKEKDRTRIDFPSFTINGETFKILNPEDSMARGLIGKDIKLEDEKAEELIKDIRELVQLDTQGAIMGQLYLGDGGDKYMIRETRLRNTYDRHDQLSKKVKKELEKRGLSK